MAKSIEQFVSEYVDSNGRGCPKGVLQFVGGYSANDIAEAQDAGIIESSRGPQGGFFVAGTKPVPQGDSPNTLKSRMVAALRDCLNGNVDNAAIRLLLEDYSQECQKRSESKKNAKK